jgi:ATP-binding cassette subfamily B protein
LFPLIADNLRSHNKVHQAGVAILSWVARRFAAIRYNASALTTLLAAGAICVVIITLVALWRRRVVATVATDVATSLRRQIHRQMYRLGQSSLPTEGVGPVINLWTREVNDVRDGLIADVDLSPRIQVLAAGLLLIALLVSPLLTTFLASLGLAVPVARRSRFAPYGPDLRCWRVRPPAV